MWPIPGIDSKVALGDATATARDPPNRRAHFASEQHERRRAQQQ
jgi:hypothetical protein